MDQAFLHNGKVVDGRGVPVKPPAAPTIRNIGGIPQGGPLDRDFTGGPYSFALSWGEANTITDGTNTVYLDTSGSPTVGVYVEDGAAYGDARLVATETTDGDFTAEVDLETTNQTARMTASDEDDCAYVGLSAGDDPPDADLLGKLFVRDNAGSLELWVQFPGGTKKKLADDT